ncbi:MAG: hypothetical protein AMJ75_03610 [Phycisphaerae bacterium SM1_79]|nr:MAG: hypothetical protein AMJ75_03610 [Phycisphaerae bacterium SM1_79]
MPLTGSYIIYNRAGFPCSTSAEVFSAGLRNEGLEGFQPGVVFNTGICDIDIYIDIFSMKRNSK